MGVINLAHGSLYMVGAYGAALVATQTGSFVLATLGGLAAAAITGMVIEFVVIRRLYARDHLDQVLATFGLILFFNQAIVLLFGRQPIFIGIPPLLSGAVQVLPGVFYPVYRLAIIVVGIAVACALYLMITHTRLGMLVRAGATHREMVRALGVDIRVLYTTVFGLGALLAGLAGLMAGPILAVQVGMGEQILIVTFVVVVIGGVGSVRGAFFGALIVGVSDTLMRAFLPGLLRGMMTGSEADALGAGLSSMGIYLLMAIVLLVRPKGLFPAHG
jgi:branched-chain amino acid transport system permease protein